MQREGQTHNTIATKIFIEEISSCVKPSILDIGCICDTNIEFLASIGCKVFVDDILDLNVRISKKTQQLTIDQTLGEIDYPETSFDGILCWDVFDQLEIENANALASKLRQLVKKGGIIYTLFRPENSPVSASSNIIRYSILSPTELRYEPISLQTPKQKMYHNRDILALFERFSFSNSYILTNGWREVIVRK